MTRRRFTRARQWSRLTGAVRLIICVAFALLCLAAFWCAACWIGVPA